MKPEMQTEPSAAMTYSETEAVLKTLPLTWYPALLKVMVEAAISKHVFRPGKITDFVSRIEGGADSPNDQSGGTRTREAMNTKTEADKPAAQLSVASTDLFGQRVRSRALQLLVVAGYIPRPRLRQAMRIAARFEPNSVLDFESKSKHQHQQTNL